MTGNEISANVLASEIAVNNAIEGLVFWNLTGKLRLLANLK